MVELRRNFRKWWQPPRKTIDRPAERRVTFLELFYDLVYVVLIAELAHSLAINVTPAGVGGFAFLFVIVWWAWFNGTSYHELHGNNDIRTRVFTFLQMFTVAAMAVFAHDALGAGSVGFALSITAFQLILVYLWWRTGIYDPDHRPLSRPYTLVYLFNALLYIASVLVAPPWRFTLWGIALILSLALPLYTRTMGRRNPALQEEVERTTAASPALVERFDLLTIIVIGEVVAGTIRGVAGQDQLSWTLGIAAGLGMLIAIGIWWIYFDFVSRHPPLPGISESTRWYFLHLPLTLGITVIGAAVFNLVEHSGDPLSAGVRWLLVGSVALTLACMALLMRTLLLHPDYVPLYRRGGIVTFATAIITLVLGFSHLSAVPLLLGTAVLLLLPVVYGMLIWIKVLGAEQMEVLG